MPDGAKWCGVVCSIVGWRWVMRMVRSVGGMVHWLVWGGTSGTDYLGGSAWCFGMTLGGAGWCGQFVVVLGSASGCGVVLHGAMNQLRCN